MERATDRYKLSSVLHCAPQFPFLCCLSIAAASGCVTLKPKAPSTDAGIILSQEKSGKLTATTHIASTPACTDRRASIVAANGTWARR
ncbi:hypothetical protein A0H81_12764 [Grifola frondosa]|uniref:Uncharacterized protein n=1 Tax=Grifola frondosa TaxID=5627 RepID=A0A1C7LRE1_GRIFR|nr:hypothetical protein A0H81_12764 [Grifola frondosa]